MTDGAERIGTGVAELSDAGLTLYAHPPLVSEAGLVREAVVRMTSTAADLKDLADALRRADGGVELPLGGWVWDGGVVDVADDPTFAALVEDGEGQVMTYNIGRGAKGRDGAEQDQLDQVAAAIAAGEPDVVSLQEVHEDDIPILLALLADQGLIYDVEFAPAISEAEMEQLIADARAEAEAKGEEFNEGHYRDRHSAYGIAVLSVNVIEDPQVTELPGGGESRVALNVTTEVGGEDITVVNTHLTTDDEVPDPPAIPIPESDYPDLSPQDQQTRAVFDLATEADGPVVITGDLNQDPGDLADNAKGYGLDGRIDVANDKGEDTAGWSTIDYVLTTPDIEVDGSVVLDEDVSDHQPVVVDIDVTP